MQSVLKFCKVAICALLFGSFVLTARVHAASTDDQRMVKEDQQITDNTYYITAKQAQQLREQNPDTVVLAIAYGKVPGFSKWHIPGAIQMSTNEVESQANHWNILDAAQLRKNFLKKGVTANTPSLSIPQIFLRLLE